MKIVHYTFAIETPDSIHPGVIAEELGQIFDPFGEENGKLHGTLIEVKSEDWNK